MTNDLPDPEAPPAPSRVPLTTATALLGLAALYTGAWFLSAHTIERQTAQFLDRQRAAGATVTSAAMEAHGFPGRVHVTLPHLSVAAPVTGGGWQWDADQVTLVAWPLTWHALDIDLSGTHRLTGLVSPQDLPVWIRSRELNGRIMLDRQGRMTRGELAAQDATLSLSENGEPWLRAAAARAAAELLAPPAAPPAPSAAPTDAHSPTLPPTVRLVLEATEVTPPNLLAVPAAGPIHRAALTAELTGQWPPGPLPEVLEAWRAEGGTLEIRDAVLNWPPLRIATSGTLALDRNLQPEGALSLHIEGGAQVLDVLAASGVLGKDDVGAAQIGLTLMSRRNAAGAQELSVPLTLQNRAISAGPLRLGKMREIGWPKLMVP